MNHKTAILYVDDEQVNLTNFSMIFENDFDIITSLSGEEALKILQNKHDDIAVLISDQRMPGMSGTELLKIVHNKYPEIIRIILTGYADFQDLTDAVNQGHIYQYIKKPCTHITIKPILLRAIESFLTIEENKKLTKEMSLRNAELEDINTKLSNELRHRKIAEEKSREAEIKMLSHAKLASLGEMSTNLAHEINQPLTFIKIMLESTKKELLDNKLQDNELLTDIEESLTQVNRITCIIDHLRTFGRTDSNEFQSLEPCQIFDSALILLRQKIRLNNIKLDIICENDLPNIRGVSIQLEQVFINLLTNAIDALQDSQEKSISLRVISDKDYVIFTVQDSGRGMEEEILNKIFEPFFTTKPIGKGTGVGLSIVYGIIHDHHGFISCSSTPGNGTCFTFKIPRFKD